MLHPGAAEGTLEAVAGTAARAVVRVATAARVATVVAMAAAMGVLLVAPKAAARAEAEKAALAKGEAPMGKATGELVTAAATRAGRLVAPREVASVGTVAQSLGARSALGTPRRQCPGER